MIPNTPARAVKAHLDRKTPQHQWSSVGHPTENRTKGWNRRSTSGESSGCVKNKGGHTKYWQHILFFAFYILFSCMFTWVNKENTIKWGGSTLLHSMISQIYEELHHLNHLNILSCKKYSFELRLQQWPCFSFAVRGPLSVGWNYLLNNGYYYFLSQELDHLGHLFSSLPASQTVSDQLQQTWYVNKNIPAPAFQRRFMNKHLALGFFLSICVRECCWLRYIKKEQMSFVNLNAAMAMKPTETDGNLWSWSSFLIIISH